MGESVVPTKNITPVPISPSLGISTYSPKRLLFTLVGKVLDMSQTCRKVGQMLEIFDSDIEVFDTE